MGISTNAIRIEYVNLGYSDRGKEMSLLFLLPIAKRTLYIFCRPVVLIVMFLDRSKVISGNKFR
jgi:hypothetical protein